MLDNKRIAAFIADKRKAKDSTQQQVADALNISFQAVSNGRAAYRIRQMGAMRFRLWEPQPDVMHGSFDGADI